MEMNEEELFEAIKNSDIEKVKLLVENGANVNAGGSLLGIADTLMYSVIEGDLEIVKYSIEHGANGIHQALCLASMNGYFEIVKYLVESGAIDIGVLYSALINTTNNGNLEIVKYLVEKMENIFSKGVDINKEIKSLFIEFYRTNDYSLNEAYTYPIITAVRHGHLEILKYFYRGKGANINASTTIITRSSAFDKRTTFLVKAAKGGHL